VTPLISEIRHNPLLWLLALVPVVGAAVRQFCEQSSFDDKGRFGEAALVSETSTISISR
jgi:hypothetical protein